MILLNFEIIGHMDLNAMNDHQEQRQLPQQQQQQQHTMQQPTQSKQPQNENIEPKRAENTRSQFGAMNTKSFFNNKESQIDNVPNSSKIISSVDKASASMSASASASSGTYNGFKIVGISSLNPYQNK
jgi:FtsZ-interacting cell division protein YlmF